MILALGAITHRIKRASFRMCTFGDNDFHEFVFRIVAHLMINPDFKFIEPLVIYDCVI